MATAGDIVRGALRNIQALTRGEAMSAEDGAEGLQALNQLVHTWYADNVLVPSLSRESFTISSGKSEYTIGTGADIDTTRPMIIASLVIRVDDIDYWLEEISERWWSQIVDKQIEGRPYRYYYEERYPDGTLYFDYEPDKTYTVYMVSYKPFSDFTVLADTLSIPPMYERALKFNLAVDLAPEYGLPVPQEVAQRASDSLYAVKRRNFANRPREASIDEALIHEGRNYDIRSDW